MHKFERGQLVAVRQQDDERWVPAVLFCEVEFEDCIKYKARGFGNSHQPVKWMQCVPAQQVWPWLKKYNARIVDDANAYAPQA